MGSGSSVPMPEKMKAAGGMRHTRQTVIYACYQVSICMRERETKGEREMMGRSKRGMQSWL